MKDKLAKREGFFLMQLSQPDPEESELADLEMETRPEDVLAEIDRLQQRALSGK